jgi:hypothetical protein
MRAGGGEMKTRYLSLFFATAALLVSARSQPSSKSAQELTAKQDDLKVTRLHLQEVVKKLYGQDAPTELKWVKMTTIQQMTKFGDVAEGTKIEEAKGESELYLDKDPCNGKVIAFHHPYEKQDTGKTKKCGEKSLPILRVLQK